MTTQVTTSAPIRVALRGHDSTARRARSSHPGDPSDRANGWLVAGSVLVAIALFSALALSSFATLG